MLRADPSFQLLSPCAYAQQGEQGAAAVERLALYWRACGIVDESRIQALCEVVWQRLAEQDGRIEVEELPLRLIEQARSLLDEALARNLLLQDLPEELAAARAALLAEPHIDWSSWLLPDPRGDCPDGLQRAVPCATPPALAPLFMAKQSLELFELRRPRALSEIIGHFGRLGWNRLLAFVGYT